MLVRADLDLPHRAGARCVRCLSRTGNSLSQHDRATHVLAGEIILPAVADIDQPAAHSFGRRRSREGVRDAGQSLIVHVHPRATRQADIGIVMQQLRPITELVQPRLDIPQAGQFVRRARQLHPAGEFLHVSHQDGPIDGIAYCAAEWIGHRVASCLPECRAACRPYRAKASGWRQRRHNDTARSRLARSLAPGHRKAGRPRLQHEAATRGSNTRLQHAKEGPRHAIR